MRLLTKLLALRAAVEEVLEELDDSPKKPSGEELEEAEILLTRSTKNRRSDQNEVMTMIPLNGAPAVPESWKRRGGPSTGAGQKNRVTLAKILADYEPMTRREVWITSREVDPRLQSLLPQKNFQQMVHRMLRVGQLSLKHDKIVMGGKG